MSKPRSVHVVHFLLYFHYDESYNLMNIDTPALLVIFRICPIIFG